ncbi:hypothetical protein ABPG77_011432 [Micractinium sp. CCAP 211/92]
MGVTGLWQLLEPVGRRISIEALQNKRLAVDASMWLFQFVRAMRDDRGEMVRNAHVIGFFRRICKHVLLFHRIRPVFVFDGSTPALKQQTVAARRRRREQQSARVNRLAEKLLLNQLKQSVIGKVTEAQLRKAAAGRGQGRGRGRSGRGRGRAALAAAEQSREEQQEQALEGGGGGCGAAAAAAAAGAPEQPPVGPSAQASTARPGARNGVRSQRTDSVAVPAAAPLVAAAVAAAAGGRHPEDGLSTTAAAAAASTAADELLAAQLAAEQWDEEEAVTVAAVAAAATRGAGGTSLQLPSVFSTLSEQRQQERARRRATRAGGKGSDAEESSGEEDDLEIVLPEHGQLDPAVMSTLPPSVALDLMMKMRERSQAENRQEFEARRAAPAAFSSFQMQTYLAGTRFRQQVSDVKDAMNASAAGDSAARRIAGEAGREYVLHKDPQLLQKEAATGAAAAAVTAGAQDAAAAGAGGGERAQPAAGVSPAAAPRASPAAPAAVPAPAVTALGAPLAAVLPGLSGSPLDICFDVEVDDGESNDDLGWEDVEQASPTHAQQEGQQQQGPPQHWRQRAAQRQKYWSLSHGFQMGRKLAAWGEGEPEEGPPEAEEGPEPGAGAAADGATPAPRKGLIGRSPPSRSPVKPVPEDEDGQLQEAIRRSLEEFTPGKAGQAADGSGRRLSLDSMETGTPKPAAPTPAAEAARMLEQKQRLLQRVHPQQGQQQAQQLPSGAATEVVDLTGADEARAAYGSGSEAELLLEDAVVAAAEADAAAGLQQAQQLRATINEQSAQRLEEWLGGGSKPAAAATTPTRVAAAEDDDDDGMLWEDAEPAPLAAQNGTTSLRIPGAEPQQQQTRAHTTAAAAAAAAAGTLSERATAQHAPRPAPMSSQMPRPPLIQQQQQHAPQTMPELQPAAPLLGGTSTPPPPPHHHQQQQQKSPQQPEGQPEWEGTQEEGEPLDFEAQLEALQAEERAMKAAQRKGQGQSDQPTQDMYQDCMELLQMFGLPYIIAPQEAEAQCAWLDYNGLVDGVVTDDNDVFLFGALRVYRHIFESKKYVEEYRSEDVQSELGVGRAELARLAQLLGGDYCEGVAGVGIVNAMEIVHAFPGPHGLRRFREWLDAPDEELVELAKGKSGKPGSEEGQESDPEAAARLEAFKRTHRGVRRSWDPPASFPSAAVDQAYAEPKVDTSKEKFTFGRPDVELLRQFCQTRLGWTSQQADDLLLPVAKAFDQRQSQLTLDSFLTKRERFAKIRSKRLQQAVTGVAGGDRKELMLKDGEQTKPVGGGSTKGRKRKTTDAAANAADGAAGSQQDSGDGYAAPQQQQEQQEPQDLDTGGLHPSQSKRQRRPAADGGPGRGRTGRGATGGRGRGRGRRPGSKGQAAASDDIDDCDAASGLPAAGQPGHGDPQDEQQQQQQQSYERGPAASQSTGEPDDQSRSSQPARRQPSRGRRAVMVLPLPDDA